MTIFYSFIGSPYFTSEKDAGIERWKKGRDASLDIEKNKILIWINSLSLCHILYSSFLATDF
jgi:hypothetical protein